MFWLHLFLVDQIVHIMADFIFPVVSAIPGTLSFVIRRMIWNPEVLLKCQKEIDDVVGRGRLPTLDDRIK